MFYGAPFVLFKYFGEITADAAGPGIVRALTFQFYNHHFKTWRHSFLWDQTCGIAIPASFPAQEPQDAFLLMTYSFPVCSYLEILTSSAKVCLCPAESFSMHINLCHNRGRVVVCMRTSIWKSRVHIRQGIIRTAMAAGHFMNVVIDEAGAC